MELFPLLLSPVLWERNGTIWIVASLFGTDLLCLITDLPILALIFLLHLNLGNIPPLVRLLQAYIEKASKVIIETKKEVMPASKSKK